MIERFEDNDMLGCESRFSNMLSCESRFSNMLSSESRFSDMLGCEVAPHGWAYHEAGWVETSLQA